MIILFCFLSCLSYASDSEFLKRPPLSSKCQAMLDKKGELDDAIFQAGQLINRSSRLAKSVAYDRKASQARVNGLTARLELRKDFYIKKRKLHYENLIREGCPTFE